jgi:lactate permease
MYSVFASIPILFIIFFIILLNKPSKIIIPISFLIAFFISFFIWKVQLNDLIAASVLGVIKSFNIIIILFSSVLFLNLIKKTTSLESMNVFFASISMDRRIQFIIINMLLQAFLEGISGFGASGIIAIHLLISIGFNPILAIIMTIFVTPIPTTFGAIGMPFSSMIITLGKDINLDSLFIHKILQNISIIHLILGVFLPIIAVFIMIFIFEKKQQNKLQKLLEILPLIIVSHIIFMGGFYFFSKINHELTSVFSAAVALFFVILFVKFKILTPKSIYRFEEDEKNYLLESQVYKNKKIMNIMRAFIPYILITVLLLITRLNLFNTKTLLQKFVIKFDYLFSLLSNLDFHYNLPIGYNSGIFPFSLIIIFVIFYYKISKNNCKLALKETMDKMKASLLILFNIFSLIEIMSVSRYNYIVGGGVASMLDEISKMISLILKDMFIFASPFFGFIGTLMSGSSTMSNILFSSLQYNTAIASGIDPIKIITLQNIGSTIGNLSSISNIIVICAIFGIKNYESKILRITLIPAILYILGSLLIVKLIT